MARSQTTVKDFFLWERIEDKKHNSPKGVALMAIIETEAYKPTNNGGDAAPPLSERQLQTLNLIAQGHTNVQIAEELNLSRHTIDSYCRRILLKFKTSSRVTAAVKASQMGLISNV